jgi:intergrase/recombinase
LSEHQKPVPNKVNKFIKDLIIPKYNEIKFVETIDKIQQEQEPNFINSTLIGSTMRMTALEQLL